MSELQSLLLDYRKSNNNNNNFVLKILEAEQKNKFLNKNV